jgi:hypothetical protein
MPRRPAWLVVTLIGIAVFCASDAVRAAGIVPGAGFAMAVVGCAGLVSSFLPADLLRREVLSVLLTLLCVSDLLVTGAAAVPLEATHARQHAFAQDLARSLPTPPTGSTILVEEACPSLDSAGPVASPLDLAGILAITYHDASLRGAVLTSRVTVRPEELTVVSADDVRTSYPYGQRLFVYNTAHTSVYPLPNADRAGRYFLNYSDRTRGC